MGNEDTQFWRSFEGICEVYATLRPTGDLDLSRSCFQLWGALSVVTAIQGDREMLPRDLHGKHDRHGNPHM